ncbi:hypothetical protein [Rubeoparvulum massiliense]|uniref:hypothetical protein n=1 Tax=Rubeoparvulum massiliense TaxID=1631346 RepID=UPI00065DD775|nr:hypothetical protein [Rubeoparvulum massiliense]
MGYDFSKYPSIYENIQSVNLTDRADRIMWISNLSRSEAAIKLAEMSILLQSSVMDNVRLRKLAKNEAINYHQEITRGIHAFVREQVWDDLNMNYEQVNAMYVK